MVILSLLLAATPFPEALKQPQLARLERFTFPTAEKFVSAWSEHTTQGIPVVRGSIRFEAQTTKAWFALWPHEGGTRLVPLVELQGETDDGWRAASTEGKTWKLTRWQTTGTFTLEERLGAEMADVDLIPWTYATTLLASSGPLYDEGAEGDEQLFAVLRGLEKPGDAQTWAKAHKADDALYARFRKFRPMGSCSMDSTPQEAARLYAEVAWERGDLGRFLQLQVRIMGDQFDRRRGRRTARPRTRPSRADCSVRASTSTSSSSGCSSRGRSATTGWVHGGSRARCVRPGGRARSGQSSSGSRSRRRATRTRGCARPRRCSTRQTRSRRSGRRSRRVERPLGRCCRSTCTPSRGRGCRASSRRSSRASHRAWLGALTVRVGSSW